MFYPNTVSMLLQKIDAKSPTNSILVGISTIQVFVLFLAAYFRLIDADEGYYLLAARLVSEGKVLYSDFFYTQMPLLPYIYALWGKIFGLSWFGARMLNAVTTLCIALLTVGIVRQYVKQYVADRNHQVQIILTTFIIFLGSNFVLNWFVVVKTYAFSIFFVMLAIWIVEVYARSYLFRSLFFAGIALGLSIQSRLFFCVLIPVFVAYIIYFDRVSKKEKSLLLQQSVFFLGLTIALAPCLYWIVVNARDQFFFGNFGYHQIRSDYSLFKAIAQKIFISIKLFVPVIDLHAMCLQFSVLFFANLLVVWRCIKNKSTNLSVLSMATMFTLFLVSFAPTPTYVQYFSILIPLLIVGLMSSDFVGQINRNRLTLYVCLYLCLVPFELYRITVSGNDVAGILNKQDASNLTISTVREISEIISNANPNDSSYQTIALWPGYSIESNSEMLDGLENHFGIEVANRLTQKNRSLYHIASFSDVAEAIAEKNSFVVIGAWNQNRITEEMLLSQGYQEIGRAGFTKVFLNLPRSFQEQL